MFYIKDPLLCTGGGMGKITVIRISRKNHNPEVIIEKEIK